MNNDNLKQIDIIAERYTLYILNWACRKLGHNSDAQDLAQEVFLQIYTALQRSEEPIHKIDNFIWTIAHRTYCKFIQKSLVQKKHFVYYENMPDCLQKMFKQNIASASDELSEYDLQLQKIRKKLVSLERMHREIMILHYLEGFSIRAIAKKMSATESKIKYYLFSGRKKIREDYQKMDESKNDYVYRPRKLNIAISGPGSAHLKVRPLQTDLVKQNLCLACYRQTRTLEELQDETGIPSAYIEASLQYLCREKFMRKLNNKYQTIFEIQDKILQNSNIKFFKYWYEQLGRDLFTSYTRHANEFKKIKFHGSNFAINKILWFILSKFVLGIDDEAFGALGKEIENGTINHDLYNMQNFEGELFRPIGIELPPYSEHNCFFGLNGPIINSELHWLGLNNFQLVEGTFDFDEYRKLLLSAGRNRLNINDLSESERLLVCKFIDDKLLKRSGDLLLPDEYLYITTEQYNQISELVKTIQAEFTPQITSYINALREHVASMYPEQLKNSREMFYIFMAGWASGYWNVWLVEDKLLSQPSPDTGYKLTLLILDDK